MTFSFDVGSVTVDYLGGDTKDNDWVALSGFGIWLTLRMVATFQLWTVGEIVPAVMWDTTSRNVLESGPGWGNLDGAPHVDAEHLAQQPTDPSHPTDLPASAPEPGTVLMAAAGGLMVVASRGAKSRKLDVRTVLRAISAVLMVAACIALAWWLGAHMPKENLRWR
jgi:hypothetical protein